MIARKERVVHINGTSTQTSESNWLVAGRPLGDLPPSYGHRPEDHAIGGSVTYSPWHNRRETDFGYTEVMIAVIPGPTLDDRLYGIAGNYPPTPPRPGAERRQRGE